MPTPGYIAATVPAKTDRVAGTTLFHLAMVEFGDPLQWVPISQLNDLVDPWIFDREDVLIPPVLPAVLRILPEIGGQPYVVPPPPIILLPQVATLTLSSGSTPTILFMFESVAAQLALASGLPPLVINSGSPRLSPAVASLSLAGPAPTMLHSLSAQPASAALTLTGQSSLTPLGIVPTVASLVLSAATPVSILSKSPLTASLTLAGTTSTVAQTFNPNFTPGVASLTLTPNTPPTPLLLTWTGPTSGLTHRWSFDPSGITGTTLLDLVGSDNGTINGTVSSVASPSGGFNAKATSFDGSTAYVTLGSLPISVTAAWSIAFWVNLPDITYQNSGNDPYFFSVSNGHLWGAFNPINSGHSGYLNFGNGGYQGLNGFGSGTLLTNAAQISDSTWVHVVMTFDGLSTGGLYINGASAGTPFSNGPGLAGSTGAFIGNNGAGNSHYLKGNLYQFCVYNRVLTSTDVSNLYAAG